MRLQQALPTLDNTEHVINGELHSKSDENQLVLIHFWKIDCCLNQQRFDLFQRWQSKFSYHLKIIGIYTSLSEATERSFSEITAYVQQCSPGAPQIIDHDGRFGKQFTNEQVPSTYLFDQHLKLRFIQVGEQGLKLLEHRIQKMIDNMQQRS
jgi:hypothetical protein